jgi:predicted nucleic acid-binding protein
VSSYFLDTSALLKRYIIESGTAWVQNIAQPGVGHSIIISQIAPIEIVSAVSRQKREGIIGERTARVIRLLVNRHAVREYEVVLLTPEVGERAQNLLETHSLRAYDSVQLASALLANMTLIAKNLSPLIFVSADVRLLPIATSEGLQTHNPT